MSKFNLQKLIFPGIALLTVIGAIVYGTNFSESNKTKEVSIFLGSEKEALMKNPKVLDELRKEYKIVPKIKVMGSRKLAKTTEQADILWPANSVDAALHEELFGNVLEQKTILQTPLVFVMKRDVVDVLIRQGIIKKEGGQYLLIDIDKFVKTALAGKTWQDLGLPQYTGPVGVRVSDPYKSSSGAAFAGLTAIAESGGQPKPEQYATIIPLVQSYFQALGFKLKSTDFAFIEAINLDAHGVLAYEFETLQYALLNKNDSRVIKYLSDNYLVVYPQQRVWADHPLLAKTPEGQLFIKAMQDPDILRIASEEHGLRPGSAGGTFKFKGYPWPPLPETVPGSTVTLPDTNFYRAFDPDFAKP